MASVDELLNKIKDLENQLAREKLRKGPVREKIAEISSEVVDSNPYRFLKNYIITFYFTCV